MLGGISPIQLVIVLVIVILIFGTKKLRGMGKDIGGAVKGFKQGMNDKDEDNAETEQEASLLQRKETTDVDSPVKEKTKNRQTQDD